MKKTIVITIVFLLGFIVGALTINLLTIPARKAYRELLQMTYVSNQRTLEISALKEGNRPKALVHIWNLIDADPVNGSKIFKSEFADALDREFWFIFFPSFKNVSKNVGRPMPGAEDLVMGAEHGRLAAVLELLGHEEAAKEHWVLAAKLLNMPENEVRNNSINAIKQAENQKSRQ